MKPELVCKITVQTPDGKSWRGSGYPITPNHIITAAHVVEDAAYKDGLVYEGAVRQITLEFEGQKTAIGTPVSIAWCGHNVGVDVAVLSCQLPLELQPAHELLTEPPQTPIAWHAHGYTEFGKIKQGEGKDAYDGTMPTFSAKAATVALGCTDGLVTSKQWAGGSGSVAFDCATSQRALAVITTYQSGKKRDQLVAVPLCYLLNSEKTRDDFRRAIQFEAYERRRDYRNDVIETVTSRLQVLGVEVLKRMAQAINALPPRRAARIDVKLACEALAEATAMAIVSQEAVTDVVACLVHLMEALGAAAAGQVAEIIDYVLPLNYAPGFLQGLQEQLAAPQLGLIDNAVASLTLAEIIMAGYDQQPAKFVLLTDGSAEVRGQTALDYSDGPEEGPGHTESASLSVLRAAYNLLYDLLARQDTLLGLPARPLHRPTAGPQQEAELERLIKHSTIRLGGALHGIKKIYGGRTVYCVLPLPPEGSPERGFRQRVLGEVRKHVPQLIFVELMQTPTDAREFEVGTYIKARVMRTQHLRQP